MEELCSRSIELMEELLMEYGKPSFEMTYSGYNFISHQKEGSIFAAEHSESFKKRNRVLSDPELIQNEFPFFDKRIQKVVFIKNAGKIDVYSMGSLLLRAARKSDFKLVNAEILNIESKASKFQIILDSKEPIEADKVVITAGPFINHLANKLGLKFPVFNTLQRKFILPDPQNIIPENMPFTIYADSQYLDWSTEEADFFASEERYKWLLEEFPGGIHIKPESGGKIKMGWAFQKKEESPRWETPNLELFPQIVLKGASRFIPKLCLYEEKMPSPLVEYAGYYTRTIENWPLIGPTKMDSVYVIGALAGFGTMSACAAGELCADFIVERKDLPEYATFFHPDRYSNKDIVKEIKNLKSDGQL